MVLPSPASPAHFDPTLSWEKSHWAFCHYNCVCLKGPLQLAPTNSFLRDGKDAWSHTITILYHHPLRMQDRNVLVFSLMHSHTACSSAQTSVFQQTVAEISWRKLALHTQWLSVFSPSFSGSFPVPLGKGKSQCVAISFPIVQQAYVIRKVNLSEVEFALLGFTC